MKLENNQMCNNLEGLEKVHQQVQNYGSHLVTTVNKLRKIPLNEFSIEDLRIMLGQDIGLNYLVPIALLKLKNNILAEGDLYPGDLLEALTKSDSKFWSENEDYLQELKFLIENNFGIIKENRLRLGSLFM